ncbi:hypothetical protein BH11ARM2_BH11ARM2_07730 [soil metagenome]
MLLAMEKSVSLLFVALAATASAQVHMPAVGSKERTAILDAVRPFEGGSKIKFTVEVLKSDGKFAYFQGRSPLLSEGEETPEYFLRKVGARWVAFGKFDPYHEGQEAGWLQAYDFRALRQAKFPLGMVPTMYQPLLRKGWYVYGLAFTASGTNTVALSAAQVAAISGARYEKPAMVQGYKAFQVAAVKTPQKR